MVVFLRLLIWPILLLAIEIVSRFYNSDFLLLVWGWYIQSPFWNLLWLWLIWEVWKLVVLDMRFYYAWWKSRSLVSMKVLLPRTDSKIDQE